MPSCRVSSRFTILNRYDKPPASSVDTVVAMGRIHVQNGQLLIRGAGEDPAGPSILDRELRT